MRAAHVLLPFVVVAATLGGCKNSESDGAGGAGGSGGGTPATTGSGGGSSESCFEPTPAGGEDSFVAVDGANTRTFEITLPDDPEGGLVTVTITGFGIFTDVRVKGEEGELLVINGVSADEDPVVSTESFVGAPGVTYEVEVEEAAVTATDLEVTVPMSWTYEPLRDCFEPNDTPAEALPIALGEDVVSHLFAGFTSNDWPSAEDHHDYFAVVVETGGTLTARFEPGVQPATLEIFAADAPDATLTEGFTIDETPIDLAIDVEPGTYLLRVEPFSTLAYNSSLGDMTGWNAPYTLRAAVE